MRANAALVEEIPNFNRQCLDHPVKRGQYADIRHGDFGAFQSGLRRIQRRLGGGHLAG